MRGKDPVKLFPDVCTRDHPRLCGEKLRWFLSLISARGSPPPMRGKGDWKQWAKAAGRITPAYAGKSSVADKTFTPQRDHHRLCGEQHTNPLELLF